MVKQLKFMLAAAIYTVTYYLIYIDYLEPTFNYAQYNLLPRSTIDIWQSIILAVLPAFFYDGLKKLSTFFALMIYTIAYVPSIIILLLALDKPLDEIFFIQGSLMLGMIMFFCADRIPTRAFTITGLKRLPFRYFHLIAILSTLMVLANYFSSLKFVGFEDVYEQRTAANEVVKGPLVGYVVMWLTTCIYPVYLALGLVKRRAIFFLGGCAGSLLIYMATAAKLSILTPLFILIIFVMLNKNLQRFAFNLLGGISAASLALLYLFPPDAPFTRWPKAILFLRTLSVSGWSNYIYYDFFTQHGHTYYTHIRIINWLSGTYPYGKLELGQVIGVQYSNSELANFNANFWASDGIAALGIPGILLINLVVFGFLVTMNNLSANRNKVFLALAFAPFTMTLLNIPFFTAILSGGGLAFMLLLLLVQIDDAPLGTCDQHSRRIPPLGDQCE